MDIVARKKFAPTKGFSVRLCSKVNISDVCATCLNSVGDSNIHMCGDCLSCCRCTVCGECQEPILLSECTACRLCVKCCRCFICASCKAPHTHKAQMCNLCGRGSATTGCGCCSHQTTVVKHTRRTVNLAKYVATTKKHLTTNKSKRLIAAEVEICGLSGLSTLPLNTTLEKWGCSVVSDGSLPTGGFEINTHPASGDFYTAQIQDIQNALVATKAHVDYRAGCHIHIDTRDFGYTGIARLLRIFACIEAGLFQITPIFRRQSSMCEYWSPQYLRHIHMAESELNEATPDSRKETVAYRRELLDALYKGHSKSTVIDQRRSKSSAMRYRGINLHSWFHRGTIECRIPVGTIYACNIINWGLLLVNIVDVAMSRTMTEVKDIVQSVEKTYTNTCVYDTKYASLTEDYKQESLELLKNLAPSEEVRDWIIERVQWAKRFPSTTDYKERFE